MHKCSGWVVVALLVLAVNTWAGARIDLRAVPPMPEGGYGNNEIVRFDVYLVDTGNPQGAISFRELKLDFSDTASELSFADPDEDGPLMAGQFHWANPFGVNVTFNDMPQVSWIYAFDVTNPLFQITLPDNMDVYLGTVRVNTGGSSGLFTIDALNADDPDAGHGARALFGWGGQFDPVTFWHAFDGEITGGSIQVPVGVPEPASLLLGLSCGLVIITRRH